MTTYHVSNFHAFSEQDIFDDGCQPETTHCFDYDQSFDASSEQALIEAICKHFDVARDALELNACDEDGRIDVARTEDANGCQASDYEVDQWKQGKKNLFYTVYTGKLELKQDAKFTL